jgi:hypothetical protein
MVADRHLHRPIASPGPLACPQALDTDGPEIHHPRGRFAFGAGQFLPKIAPKPHNFDTASARSRAMIQRVLPLGRVQSPNDVDHADLRDIWRPRPGARGLTTSERGACRPPLVVRRPA